MFTHFWVPGRNSGICESEDSSSVEPVRPPGGSVALVPQGPGVVPLWKSVQKAYRKSAAQRCLDLQRTPKQWPLSQNTKYILLVLGLDPLGSRFCIVDRGS